MAPRMILVGMETKLLCFKCVVGSYESAETNNDIPRCSIDIFNRKFETVEEAQPPYPLNGKSDLTHLDTFKKWI